MGPVISSCLIYSTALICMLVGVAQSLSAWEDWELSRQPDVVFGTSTRVVLCGAALLHLAGGGTLLAARNRLTQASLLLWLGLNHIVYRVGLAWLDASTPLVILRVLGMKVGIHARTLDTAWKWFMAYLIVSSLVVLVLEWRRIRRERNAEYLAQWQARRKSEASHSTGD